MPDHLQLAATDPRASFLAACERGDHHRAANAARELLAVDSGGRTIRLIARQVAAAKFGAIRPIRIAVLASYSAEFIEEALVAACFLRGLAAEIYLPGFNQFRQEILDRSSGLYRFGADLVIVSVLGETLCPRLYESMPDEEPAAVAGAIAEVKSLLDALRVSSNAAVVIQGLLPPPHPLLGVGDAGMPHGQRAQVRSINAGFAQLSKALPGVYVLDYEALVARHGNYAWHDERMRHFAQLPLDKRVFLPLANEYAKYANILKGGAKKCIVVDLDNTLWGGIIGEDGPNGIKLDTVYPGSAYLAFQRTLASLNDRGILLAIASKNNPADVDEVFDNHPHMFLGRERFAASKVGWQPKSVSVREIAEELSIGLEHIVLIDDNPAECAEVSQSLPMVRTLRFPEHPEGFAALLAEDGLFDAFQVSGEDRKRTQLYQQRAQAEQLRGQATNLEDFYRGLDMWIRVDPIDERTLPRAAQLTQKTNQLNLTTPRYSESDIQARLTDQSWHCCTVRVGDRFGDHGIVGVQMARLSGTKLVVDTFLLSCRVIGRTVETAMLADLCSWAARHGATSIDAKLIPTPKNVPVRSLLPDHGFVQYEHDEIASSWRLDLTVNPIRRPEWFRDPDV